MSNSIIKSKSFEFAVYIVKFYRQFSVKNREYILSRQLLRSELLLELMSGKP